MLYEMISKRKSVRDYLPDREGANREEIALAMKGLEPLWGMEAADLELVPALPGGGKKAPYDIIIRDRPGKWAQQNGGYMGEQLALGLLTLGYGTCYRGTAIHFAPKKTGMKNIIIISVGKPRGVLYRLSTDEFRRKDTAGVCGGQCDPIIAEAVRLAPSAVNRQPWYVFGEGGMLHVYSVGLDPYGFTPVDIGIAFCHIDLAVKYLGKRAVFTEAAEHRSFNGKKYVASLRIEG